MFDPFSSPWILKVKKTIIALLLAAIFFCGFFIFQIKLVMAVGPTEVTQDINTPTTWNLAGSPYHIPGWVRIFVRSTLTIEPGVVVKIDPDSWAGDFNNLDVLGSEGGKIIASGTANQPIVFTSINDLEFGAELNYGQNPAKGDWRSIRFFDDDSVLDHVIVRYGAKTPRHQGVLDFRNYSRAKVTNSTIELNQNGGLVISDYATPTFDNLILRQNDNTTLVAAVNSNFILKNSLIQNNGGEYVFDFDAGVNFTLVNNIYENNGAFEGIYIHDHITQDRIWGKVGLPYIFRGEVSVDSGAKLKIEPGVILKFRQDPNSWNDARLLVNGALEAAGTEAEQIIFTSIKDDIGGDTNRDGNTSVPQPHDWGEIAFENAAPSIIANARITYAGEYFTNYVSHTNSLYLKNSSLTIKNVKIENGNSAGNGIFQEKGGTFTLEESEVSGNLRGVLVSAQTSALPIIKNNKIFNNGWLGLQYDGEEILDARQNWWGDDSGPWAPNHQDRLGNEVLGNVLYDPWLGKENLPVASLEPVILVPGILGSWMRPVCEIICVPEYVPDPILNTYDSLWQALKKIGYQEHVNLFAFGYNWRLDNNITAELLKQKIAEVKQITGKNKVDLVTHSMGGLVARAYIQSAAYANDVDQLIFLGTPQLGSPKAYLQYEAVEGFEAREGYIAKIYFSGEALSNGYTSLVKYVQEKVPALGQLLPIYNYLKKQNGNNWVFRTYPTENYVQNTFLETLNLSAGVNLLKQRVKIYNIVSNYGDASTITSLRTVADPDPTDNKWIHGYPENFDNLATDQGLEYGAGDKTVPLSSTTGLPGITPIMCEGGPEHDNMPTECQRQVIQILTNKWPVEIFRANLIQKLLLIYVHSPVKFQVIDQNGQITGTNFSDNSGLENIPNSLFDEENGFVFLKNPGNGEYKINIIGIDNGGNYGLSVDVIDDIGGQQSLTEGTIAPGEVQNYKIDYDSASSAPVVIEEVRTEITIDDIIKDVKAVAASGGFKQKNLDKLLITQLNLAKRWEEKLVLVKKEWQKRIYQNLILIDLRVAENLLKVWLKTKRIDQLSYDLLINDFNLLIKQYK
jgi:pimeloyl-ACP methyl ester carboxylesterase